MLTFAEALKRDIENIRVAFIAEQERKAPRRKPKRVGYKPSEGSLFAMRNKRLTIREAALRLVQIVMRYKKATTGETKQYVVAPYSYRYRRLKSGWRKMLFAYDMREKHIKGFVVANIRNVSLTDRKFVPKWDVELLLCFSFGLYFIVA